MKCGHRNMVTNPSHLVHIYIRKINIISPSPIYSPLGNKGISPYNLVRLKLTTAHTTQIFKSPRFGQTYHLLLPDQIRALYKEVVKNLTRNDQYGPFDALTCLCGPRQAQVLAAKGECYQRPMITQMAPSHLRSVNEDITLVSSD